MWASHEKDGVIRKYPVKETAKVYAKKHAAYDKEYEEGPECIRCQRMDKRRRGPTHCDRKKPCGECVRTSVASHGVANCQYARLGKVGEYIESIPIPDGKPSLKERRTKVWGMNGSKLSKGRESHCERELNQDLMDGYVKRDFGISGSRRMKNLLLN